MAKAVSMNDVTDVEAILAEAVKIEQESKKYKYETSTEDLESMELAVKSGNLNLLKALLHGKVNVKLNFRHNTETPLLFAMRRGYLEIFEMLVSAGCDIDAADTNGITPLMEAVRQLKPALVELLIERGPNTKLRDRQNNNVFHYLIPNHSEFECTKEVDILKIYILNMLLNVGTEIFKCKHLLAYIIKQRCVDEAKQRCVEEAKLLIDCNCPVDSMDESGDSALSLAVISGKSLLHSLIEKGCYVNQDGKTALYKAVEHCKQSMVRSLLENGAHTSVRNTRNETLLRIASKKDRDGTEILKALLVADKSGVNLQDGEGTTALLLAVNINCIRCARILLENGSDPNISNNFGQTALMLATGNKNRHILQVLLEAGVDLNATDKRGYSVLNYVGIGSSNRKWVNVLKMLLKKGCDVTSYKPVREFSEFFDRVLVTNTPDVSWYLIIDNCSNTTCNYQHVVRYLACSDDAQLAKTWYLSGASQTPAFMICMLSSLSGERPNSTRLHESRRNRKNLRNLCNNLDLKSGCRRVIRKCIGPGITRKITKLGLPVSLQDFVLLKDWLPREYFDLQIEDDDTQIEN